jgi:hypothetical protein
MTSWTGTETNDQYTNPMEEASIAGRGYLVSEPGFRGGAAVGAGR